MKVRQVQNLDKLAIVLSLAVITLVLMAQTIYASGSARVAGTTASGSLSFQVGDATVPDDEGQPDPCDASPTSDDCVGGGGGGDGGAPDPCDASPTPDQCDEGGGGGGVGEATPTDDGPRGDKPIPPGQLKRRGIFGTVSATGTDDNGTYVILATKFGDVTVYTGDAGAFEEGDRFTALLNRSPVSATGTTDSFRTVSALRVKKIPGKPSRGHRRSVVVDSASGTDDEDTLTILDEDGNEIVLENGGASGTLDGEDVILLIQELGEGLPPTVLGGITSFSVGKRLEKLLEKGSPEKLAKLAELIQKRVDRLEARLQRIEDRAPARLKDKVRGARDKSKGKGRGASGGDDGDGGDKGKPDKGGGGDKDKPDKGGGGGKGKPDK